jgi:hypothetical protein
MASRKPATVDTVAPPIVSTDKPQGDTVDIVSVKRSILTGYATLFPFILAMVTLATKGKKENRIGVASACASIASPALTAWFALCEAHRVDERTQFSADDLQAAFNVNVRLKTQSGEWIYPIERAVVGKSLGDFYSALTKTMATRSDVLKGFNALARRARKA